MNLNRSPNLALNASIGASGAPARPPMPYTPTKCSIRNVPPTIESPCAGDYIRDLPYYSTVGVPFTRTGPATDTDTYTYTRLADRFGWFSYGKGGAVVGCAGLTATRADTNLNKPSQTNSGEKVWIRGLGVQIVGGCSALARHIFRHSHVELVWGDKDSGINLGRLEMMPGGSGLFGVFADDFTQSSINGAGAHDGHITNGSPTLDNFRRSANGLLWMPLGAEDGGEQTSLRIDLVVDRDIVLTLDKRDVAAADATKGYQTEPAFGVPASLVRLDLCCTILGTVYGSEALVGQVQAG